MLQSEAAGALAGVHEVYDSAARPDALAVCSSFAASGVVVRLFDRAHASHLLHAIVVRLHRADAAALCDMQFRWEHLSESAHVGHATSASVVVNFVGSPHICDDDECAQAALQGGRLISADDGAAVRAGYGAQAQAPDRAQGDT